MMEVVDARSLVVVVLFLVNACGHQSVAQDTASVAAETNASTHPAGQHTASQVKAVFEAVRSPMETAAVGEGQSCRKNPHCGPDLECCFDPTSDTATCAKECAEISLVACVTKADCDPGLNCIDVGYDVNICAP
jgi:hypothetical protein